jgi:(p)ppGpp synthase/HD superfamily hydrolase
MYGDLPYFTHPLAVAEAVKEPTEDELVAALLHDVVEDTPRTLQDVSDYFGDRVASIVDLLTKRAGIPYQDGILRIVNSGNRSAIKIKWADNYVNMNGDKSHMDQDRRDRLNTKYAASFITLSAVLVV